MTPASFSAVYPDVDPKRAKRHANFMAVRDMGGLFLGLFTKLEDLERWAAGRPGTTHRVLLHVDNRIVNRWSIRTRADGEVCWRSDSTFKGL